MKQSARPFKGYFPLFMAFFRASLSLSLSFRLNFALEVVMNLIFLGASFLTVSFLFDHARRIGPWDRSEFLLFLSFVFVLNQLHYLLFASNFYLFARDIREGKLDFHLLKPPSPLFVIFSREQAPAALISGAAALGALIYFGIEAGLSWIHWLFMPFLILLGLGFSFLLEALLSLFNLFTTGGHAVNGIRLQIQQTRRWPDFIYKNPARFFLMPFLLASSAPGRFLADLSFFSWILWLLAAFAGLFAFLLFIAPFALRLYKPPSS